MITIDDQRVWLERIMASPVIGFVVQDGTSGLMQCVDGDPELRMALIEWQTQRIRELERSQRQPGPVSYPVREDVPLMVTGSMPIDPSLIGDEQALADGDEQALTDLAWQINNAGADRSNTPTFPGS